MINTKILTKTSINKTFKTDVYFKKTKTSVYKRYIF